MKTFTSFDQLLEVVRAEKPKDGFSAVCSNPPYQADNDSNSATAVYHHFMSVAQEVSNYISMIYPLRWTNGGQGDGLAEFAERETKSKNYIKYLVTFNSGNLFTGVEIKGGLNWFLWSKRPVTSTFVDIDKQIETRNGLSNGLEIVVLSILGSRLISTKLKTVKSFSEIVASRDWYGKDLTNELSLMKVQDQNSPIRCFYAPRGSGSMSFIRVDSEFVTKSTDDYKVFTLKTAPPLGYPKDESRRGRIFIGKPNDCASISFLKIGSFDNEQAAINCLFYMKTDFFVFLQTVASVTHNSTRRSYRYIPSVNFDTGEILDKPGTFLDFLSPETLDDQLAAIYNLTEDERNLMTKELKPWKDKTSVTADM